MNKQIKLIILGSILVLIIGGAWYIVQNGTIPFNNQDNKKATTTPETNNGVEIDNNPVIEKLPKGVKVPSLDRQIIFPASFSQESQVKTRARISELLKDLKNNPNNLAPWLELGSLRKSIEDYEGAREAWEFAKAIRPGDWMAYHNLADLHGYYLKNKSEAEKNILEAIRLAPNTVQLYVKAAEIYIDVFNDTTKAKNILDQGLSTNPGNATLTSFRSTL